MHRGRTGASISHIAWEMPNITAISQVSRKIAAVTTSFKIVALSQVSRTIVGFILIPGPAGRDASSGLIWTNATTDQTLESGKAYKANSISQLNFDFTGIGVFGDQIKVQGYGLGGFHITIPDGVIMRQEGNPNIITAIDSNYHESDSVLFTCLNDNDTWVADMRGCAPTLL